MKFSGSVITCLLLICSNLTFSQPGWLKVNCVTNTEHTKSFYSPELKSFQHTNKKFKTDIKGKNYIFLSLKEGYHTGNEPNMQWGFTAGWVTNISAGVIISNKWEFGLNVDFWRSSNDNYPISNSIIYKRDYKAEGVSLMFKYRVPLNKELLVLKIGMELGNYKISGKSLDGFFDAEQYFNIGAAINMEIRLNSFLSIETEATYNNLIGFNQPNHFFKFTIGPKLQLDIN